MASTSPFSTKHGSEDCYGDGGFTPRPTTPSGTSATVCSTPNDPSDMLRWSLTDLVRYLTSLGCERETLEIVTVSNLSGQDSYVNLSDPSFGSPMDFLSQELLVTDGMRRRRILADVRHAQRLDSQDERSSGAPMGPTTPVDKLVDIANGVKVKDLFQGYSLGSTTGATSWC